MRLRSTRQRHNRSRRGRSLDVAKAQQGVARRQETSREVSCRTPAGRRNQAAASWPCCSQADVIPGTQGRYVSLLINWSTPKVYSVEYWQHGFTGAIRWHGGQAPNCRRNKEDWPHAPSLLYLPELKNRHSPHFRLLPRAWHRAAAVAERRATARFVEKSHDGTITVRPVPQGTHPPGFPFHWRGCPPWPIPQLPRRGLRRVDYNIQQLRSLGRAPAARQTPLVPKLRHRPSPRHRISAREGEARRHRGSSRPVFAVPRLAGAGHYGGPRRSPPGGCRTRLRISCPNPSLTSATFADGAHNEA
jgi:hypothetical protein